MNAKEAYLIVWLTAFAVDEGIVIEDMAEIALVKEAFGLAGGRLERWQGWKIEEMLQKATKDGLA